MAEAAIKLFQALVRPRLIAGGERVPMVVTFCAGALLLLLAAQKLSWPVAGVGAIVMIYGIRTIRRINRDDPHKFEVYRRSLQYRSFYPPRSRLSRKR